MILEVSDLSIEDVIINICKNFLNTTTRVNEAASICLGRFFTREDIKKEDYLQKYIEWAQFVIEENQEDPRATFFIVSIWKSLVSIFKILHRTDLLGVFDRTYLILFPESDKDTTKVRSAQNLSTLRHWKTKLAQRLGLAMLRPIDCSWLYKKSKKSLQENLQKYKNGNLLKTNVSMLQQEKAKMGTEGGLNDACNEGLDDDVDLDKLENIIGFLFDQLDDRDTVVRWSAAKGIGRLTSRLDLDLANDILDAILDTFQNLTEFSWHGGLMTLGE
jgi:hypothetical protein